MQCDLLVPGTTWSQRQGDGVEWSRVGWSQSLLGEVETDRLDRGVSGGIRARGKEWKRGLCSGV